MKRTYTLEKILLDSSKFLYRQDFRNNHYGSYDAARRHGLLDIACIHMQPQGNKYYRYVYELIDYPFVYVGLTKNFEKRLNEHLSKSKSQIKKLIKSKSKFTIVSKLLPLEKAQQLEKRLIAKYRNTNDWNVLNTHKGGGIGALERKWDFKTVENKIKGKSNEWIIQNCAGAYTFIKNAAPEERKYLMSLIKYKRKRSSDHQKKAWSTEEIKSAITGKTHKEIRESKDRAVLDALRRHPDKASLRKLMKPVMKRNPDGTTLFWTDEKLLDTIIGITWDELNSKYPGALDRISNHPQKEFFRDLIVRKHIRTGKYSKKK